MRLRDLPDFPALYLDFVDQTDAARGVFAWKPGRDSLMRRVSDLARKHPRPELDPFLDRMTAGLNPSSAAQDNIRRLALPGTVAVVSPVPPAVLGGSLSRLLQCLSTLKLAEILQSEGHPAVPLAWLSPSAPVETDLRLLDGNGRIVHPKSNGQTEVLLDELIHIYGELLQNTHLVDARRAGSGQGGPGRATGLFLSSLLGDRGLVVIDGEGLVGWTGGWPGPLQTLDPVAIEAHISAARRRLSESGYGACAAEERQAAAVPDLLVMNALLPVAAQVVSGPDVCRTAELLPLSGLLGIDEPPVWPALSATLLDARNRKTLGKYSLELPDLFAGQEELLAKLDRGSRGEETIGRFDVLLREIDARVEALTHFVPAGDPLAEVVSDSRSRMQYQVAKLREHYASSLALRREAAGRQLSRLCDSLAPEGRRQESRICAIHFVLRYSSALLDEVLRKTDVWDFQHQIIFLD